MWLQFWDIPVGGGVASFYQNKNKKKPPELEKNVVTCAVVKQRHVCTSSLWLSLKANILFLFFFVFVSFGGSAFVLDGDPEPTMKLRVQNDRWAEA